MIARLLGSIFSPRLLLASTKNPGILLLLLRIQVDCARDLRPATNREKRAILKKTFFSPYIHGIIISIEENLHQVREAGRERKKKEKVMTWFMSDYSWVGGLKEPLVEGLEFVIEARGWHRNRWWKWSTHSDTPGISLLYSLFFDFSKKIKKSRAWWKNRRRAFYIISMTNEWRSTNCQKVKPMSCPGDKSVKNHLSRSATSSTCCCGFSRCGGPAWMANGALPQGCGLIRRSGHWDVAWVGW